MPIQKLQINPLSWTAMDFGSGGSEPTLEEALRFICPQGTPSDAESLIQRYREINKQQKTAERQANKPLALVLDEMNVLGKIVWPLQQAKASYMVGNYLATIALCGMVAEMVAIYLWETAGVRINERSMKKKDEKELFGKEFERLPQERRINILSAYRRITTQAKDSFNTIRKTRNTYIHVVWSEEHDSGKAQKDAGTVFREAVSLVLQTDAIVAPGALEPLVQGLRGPGPTSSK